MLNACEQRLLVRYLANAASCLHHRDREAKGLVEWITDNGIRNRTVFGSGRRASRAPGRRRKRSRALPANFGHKGPGLDDLLAPEELEALEDCADGPSGRQWSRLGEALRSKCAAAKSARSDRTAQRLRCLGRTAELNRSDVAILELMLRYHTQPIIESMIDDVFGHSFSGSPFNLKGPVLPALLGESANALLRRLRADAPLVRSGLVCIDGKDGELTLVDRLHRLATLPGGPGLDVRRLLLGEASPSEFEWSDFDHLGHDRDHVEKLLGGALETGAAGVNVLLYGPPGTGKTELCKVLAGRLGVELHSVGEADDDGDEPNRHERLQELRLAQRLTARGRRSLLLFDEMEDLLSDPFAGLRIFGRLFSSGSRGPRAGGGSKVFMNRLLEEAPAPTLWTLNDAGAVDPALLRRMMFALELRLPPPGVRARVWTRQLARHGIEAGPEDASSLAREFEAAPGVAAGATAAARLGGGDLAAVRRGVRSLSRVLSGEKPPQGTPPRYDPALLRADTDPVRLADRLAISGERRFSLCLQGPPGTGKSAFVRYLADRLGLEVVQKRASDLMSMWVGETERQVAAAFAEARDSGAFLVFDEADSLLSDRRFARRSWEVSQVNEMLAWMESHPAPFACTTNYGERLDPATLRRFTFKVTLDYLAPEQSKAAFRGYFGLEPPAELTALAALTPGDFAVVRRKAEVLGCLREPATLAAMLRAECDAKPDRPRAIGFRP